MPNITLKKVDVRFALRYILLAFNNKRYIKFSCILSWLVRASAKNRKIKNTTMITISWCAVCCLSLNHPHLKSFISVLPCHLDLATASASLLQPAVHQHHHCHAWPHTRCNCLSTAISRTVARAEQTNLFSSGMQCRHHHHHSHLYAK